MKVINEAVKDVDRLADCIRLPNCPQPRRHKTEDITSSGQNHDAAAGKIQDRTTTHMTSSRLQISGKSTDKRSSSFPWTCQDFREQQT
jgi:hypothetical protein